MISYIQSKVVDHKRIECLLDICAAKNHYTNAGPVKYLLEAELEKMIEAPPSKRVLCISNGTTALHALMMYYENLHNKKLKWVTPAFTFPSCVVNNSNTIVKDIDELTYTLNPVDVEDADGIIITNLFGTVASFDVSNFKDKIIIYDNASSFMSKTDEGINICLLGNASFASLHHTKSLGFGEGGFIVIDSDMYDSLQALCGFGFRPEAKIHDIKASNYKMSDVSAAYILQHIEKYDIELHLYNQNLFIEKLDDIKLFNYSKNVFYGNIPIVFKSPIDPYIFKNLGIEANKYYKPIQNYPNSTYLYDRIINFPLNESLTNDEIQYICTTIKNNYK